MTKLTSIVNEGETKETRELTDVPSVQPTAPIDRHDAHGVGLVTGPIALNELFASLNRLSLNNEFIVRMAGQISQQKTADRIPQEDRVEGMSDYYATEKQYNFLQREIDKAEDQTANGVKFLASFRA